MLSIRLSLYRGRMAALVLLFLAASSFPQAILEAQAVVPELTSRSAILMDAATGTILFSKNPDEKIPPASLTKLVTTHIALREAPRRNISFDTVMNLPAESWARNQPPRSSLMWLDEGQIVTLRELLLGLAIPSGNDAAVAVALNFAPSIEDFSRMMTGTMRDLGLSETIFVEPSGVSEDNWTTAREFADFCREYIKLYPQNLKELHSVPEFAYPKSGNVPPGRRRNPLTIIQSNHIGLLNRYEGVDGLKTGYIDEAGFNLALTAEREGTRFIVVLLGVPAEMGRYYGPRARDADGSALLDWGYAHYKTLRVAYPELETARIWKGKKNRVAVQPVIERQETGESAAITVLKERGAEIMTRQEMIPGLTAPIEAGALLGKLVVIDNEGELAQIALRAAEDVERGNLLKRFWDSIVMFFTGVRQIAA